MCFWLVVHNSRVGKIAMSRHIDPGIRSRFPFGWIRCGKRKLAPQIPEVVFQMPRHGNEHIAFVAPEPAVCGWCEWHATFTAKLIQLDAHFFPGAIVVDVTELNIDIRRGFPNNCLQSLRSICPDSFEAIGWVRPNAAPMNSSNHAGSTLSRMIEAASDGAKFLTASRR